MSSESSSVKQKGKLPYSEQTEEYYLKGNTFSQNCKQFSTVKHWPEDSVVMEISAASFMSSVKKPYKSGMVNTVFS